MKLIDYSGQRIQTSYQFLNFPLEYSHTLDKKKLLTLTEERRYSPLSQSNHQHERKRKHMVKMILEKGPYLIDNRFCQRDM